MAEETEEWNDRYQQIAHTCDVNSCKPCVYPNCQRFAIERKTVLNLFMHHF